MNESDLPNLSKQDHLAALCAEDIGEAFPYHDVRCLRADLGLDPDALIAELDVYFADIAGYATSEVPISECSRTRLNNIARDMACGFFEIHPEYEPVRAAFLSPDYPVLRRMYLRYEAMRMLLLEMAKSLSQDP